MKTVTSSADDVEKYVLTTSQFTDPVSDYARRVVSGKVPVCSLEYLACKRHLNDLLKSSDPDYPFIFDTTRMERFFRFAAQCRHVRGTGVSGTPIKFFDAHEFDMGCIMGWVEKETGARRFSDSYIEEARGSAKSTRMSVLANYGLASDCIYPPYHPELARFEYMPEIECAAVDKEQAKRVWGDAQAMARCSPKLLKVLKVQTTKVANKKRGGYMRALSRETKNKDSGAPCIVIIDEYHAHTTSEIHDVLRSGFGKREQSLMVIITTAGSRAENSPCYRERNIAIKILQGAMESERYFVMIRQLDKTDDPNDEDAWKKANVVLRFDTPYAKNLWKEYREQHDLAFQSGDKEKIREFLVKRCNLWQADNADKYFSECIDIWKECAVSKEELKKLMKGREVNIGYDFGKTTDLSGICGACFLDDGRLAIKGHFFLPEETVTKHEQSDRIPYRAWIADGWGTQTEGAVTDTRYAENWIYRNDRRYKEFLLDSMKQKKIIDLQEVLRYHEVDSMEWIMNETDYDGHNATDLAARLGDTYGEDRVVEINQATKGLNEATKKLKELILNKQVVHDGNPVMTWCLSNAVAVINNFGDIKLNKKTKDDTQRIDPVAALINALARLLKKEDRIDVNAELARDDWHL